MRRTSNILKTYFYFQISRWEERWEHLQLILEVYQFARDAAVAEAWLLAQDPYLKSEEYGHTIDEVENLIKKHEAFEKAASAQEERFAALERLTTVSDENACFNGIIYIILFQFELKDMKRRQDEDMLRQQDLIDKQKEQARYELIIPVSHDLIDIMLSFLGARISQTPDQRPGASGEKVST